MAMHFNQSPPIAVTADYTKQSVPAYMDNPLIEALPPPQDIDLLLENLRDVPKFDSSERELPTQERYIRMLGLRSIMVPTTRHTKLAGILDGLMRDSLVGRQPHTAEYIASLQELYGLRKAGIAVPQSANATRWDALSSALIGLSGVGKTTTIRRILSYYDQAIYHPKLTFTQLTYIVIECPPDGATARGLAIQFFERVDAIMMTSYCAENIRKGSNEDILTTIMASIAKRHCLAMLVIEDVQNIVKAGKEEQKRLPRFLRLLVNKLHHALLMVGTNKAAELVRQNFSEARRASGFGVSYWDRYYPPWLSPEELAQASLFQSGYGWGSMEDEWTPFITVLWRYQWVQNHAVLDRDMEKLFFELTQGIPDVMIKLFVAAQFAAMITGTEKLTGPLIVAVFDREFGLLKPMINALASGDPIELMKFDDLTPLDLTHTLGRMADKNSAGTQRKRTKAEMSESLVSQVSTSLVATGIGPESARRTAEEVVEGGQTDALRGVQDAIKLLEPMKVRREKGVPAEIVEASMLELEPEDFRRILFEAQQKGVPVAEVLLASQRAILSEIIGDDDAGLLCAAV